MPLHREYHVDSPSRPSGGARRAIVALVTIAASLVPAARSVRGEVLLVRADCQPEIAVTQPGWTPNEIPLAGNPAIQVLALTASGSAAGITATLDGGDNWSSRGNQSDRATVQGTTFNDVVADLWFNRQNSFTLTLTGLLTGTQYTVRSWHNDSYTLNAGAAAGGGSVVPSVTGGLVLTATNGTITNLRGSQTDSAFGIMTLGFTATASTAVVTMTRVGGDFTGVPLSGLEVMTMAVPEPGSVPLLALAAAIFAACRRRFR